MKLLWILLLSTTYITLTQQQQQQQQYKRVCYFTNWSQHRRGSSKFRTSDIDATLCTHINYAFAQINEQHEIATTGTPCSIILSRG